MPDLSLRASATGRTSPVALLASATPVRAVPRRSWPAFLATAALVLMTLIASYVVFVGRLRPQGPAQPAFIPALMGTPEASPVPGITEDTVVFHHILDDIPADAMWAGIERATIDPGPTGHRGSPQTTTGIGPMLYRVEQGVAMVHTEGPIGLTRAGENRESPIAAGTDLMLQVGDVAYAPTNVLTDWRNKGTTPLVILDAGVAIPGVSRRRLVSRQVSPIDG